MSQLPVEKRLEIIEGQLRCWKRLSLILLACGVVALAGWAPLEGDVGGSVGGDEEGETVGLKDVLPEKPTRPDEMELRRLSIVDGQGQTRIDLAVTEVGPTIRLFDEKGTPRATLFQNADGSGLSLTDARSNTRAGLSVLDNNAEFRLLDNQGQTWAVLTEKAEKRMFVLAGTNQSSRLGALLSDGAATLTVAGGGGQRRITTRAGSDGAEIKMIDADGSTLFRQP